MTQRLSYKGLAAQLNCAGTRITPQAHQNADALWKATAEKVTVSLFVARLQSIQQVMCEGFGRLAANHRRQPKDPKPDTSVPEPSGV